MIPATARAAQPATRWQREWRDAVVRLAKRLGLGGRLAVERGFLPKAVDGLLAVDEALDLTPLLRRARATKTEAELAILARCAEAVAIGQSAFLDTIRPGRSELAVFADVRCAIEEFAGCRRIRWASGCQYFSVASPSGV